MVKVSNPGHTYMGSAGSTPIPPDLADVISILDLYDWRELDPLGSNVVIKGVVISKPLLLCTSYTAQPGCLQARPVSIST